MKETTGFTIRILEPEGRIIEIYKEDSMKPTNETVSQEWCYNMWKN